MSFKFAVGQVVEYTPAGDKPALYKVVRRMPVEPFASDLRYLIKAENDGVERNVLECHLRSDLLAAEGAYRSRQRVAVAGQRAGGRQ